MSFQILIDIVLYLEMSVNIADIGPTMAACYTGPTVRKNFVHVWTIADFKNKMEKSKTGKRILSDGFYIGDTEWHLWLYPAGRREEDKGWVSVFIDQKSNKTVTATFDFFTGKLSTGEFIKTCGTSSEKQWVENSGENGWGRNQFVSHEDINNLPLLRDGSFEMISRITVNGANAKTDLDVATEEIYRKEILHGIM